MKKKTRNRLIALTVTIFIITTDIYIWYRLRAQQEPSTTMPTTMPTLPASPRSPLTPAQATTTPHILPTPTPTTTPTTTPQPISTPNPQYQGLKGATPPPPIQPSNYQQIIDSNQGPTDDFEDEH